MARTYGQAVMACRCSHPPMGEQGRQSVQQVACRCSPPSMGEKRRISYQEGGANQIMSQQKQQRPKQVAASNQQPNAPGWRQPASPIQRAPPQAFPQQRPMEASASRRSQRDPDGSSRPVSVINIEIARSHPNAAPRGRTSHIASRSRQQPLEKGWSPPENTYQMICKCGKVDPNQSCACGSSDGEQTPHYSQYSPQQATRGNPQACMCGDEEEPSAAEDSCECDSTESIDPQSSAVQDDLVCMCAEADPTTTNNGSEGEFCRCSDTDDVGEMEHNLPGNNNMEPQVKELEPIFSEPEEVPCPCDPKAPLPCKLSKVKERKKSISVEVKNSNDKQNGGGPKCPVCGQSVSIPEGRRGAIAGKRVCVSGKASKSRPSVSFCPSCSQVIMSSIASSNGQPTADPNPVQSQFQSQSQSRPRERCGFCRKMLPEDESKGLPQIPQSMINDRMPASSFPPMLSEQLDPIDDCCCNPKC